VLRADRCISSNSLEARVPFGDLDFVKYVMSVNPGLKMNRFNKGKYLLRHSFEGDYLPHEILYREKAAFSDAVGHSMVDQIKAYAEKLYTDEEFAERSAKYSFATPFTKESLLYRELFEAEYPGQRIWSRISGCPTVPGRAAMSTTRRLAFCELRRKRGIKSTGHPRIPWEFAPSTVCTGLL
jgi:asparagine synthetase B (glutamine-hydrolysing)